MLGKWQQERCPWNINLQNPYCKLSIPHRNPSVKRSLSFSPRLLLASSTSQYHPKVPMQANILPVCSLAQMRMGLRVDGKSDDKLKDVNPAASLRRDDFGVPLDLPITRMTYFRQSQVKLFQQTTENWKTDQWKQCWFISNDFIGCSYWRLNNAFELRAGALCCAKAVFQSMFPAEPVVTVS